MKRILSAALALAMLAGACTSAEVADAANEPAPEIDESEAPVVDVSQQPAVFDVLDPTKVHLPL